MGNMRFKLGDRVRIKSLDWYNENKNSYDNCDVVFANGWLFSKPMSNFCGKELIIEKISHTTNPPHYIMKDTMFAWTDEMIEGLVEEETLIKLTGKPIKNDEMVVSINEYTLPEGYIFKDEHGNVINATKIVLEKKENEYPKTYEECCKILGCKANHFFTDFSYNGLDIEISDYENKIEDLLKKFRKLRYCRDAYWKIAGEEMGLRKPWEPDWAMFSGQKHCIIYSDNEIKWRGKSFVTEAKVFAFPTKEMRDAFYENFKELINECKELL